MTRYINPHLRDTKRKLWDFFLWKMGYYNDSKPKENPPKDFVYPFDLAPFSRAKPYLTWIGHSSFLISFDGYTLLTDPVWSTYCSPIPIARFKRQISPSIALEELPPIDFVLLSHNHYDHLDAKTVKFLKTFQPQIEWIIPDGLSPWFHRRGIMKVHELKWWQSHNLARGSITAVPAQHFSGRTLWDKNRTHWNGYLLDTGHKKLYFAGDTGYNPYDFKAIGEKWEGIDLSLIPIGTYVPEKFMQPVHISPVEAVQIHSDVRSSFSIGMHWKTFLLSDEPPDSPPYDLYLAMKEKQLPFPSFVPVEPGTYVNW